MPIKTLNVLVAEDSEHDFKQIQRAFKKGSYPVNITRCIEAEEALRVIKERAGEIDILISDYMMPGKTGLDLAEILIAEEAPFPIILLTGEGDENIAVRALKLGVYDYLAKDTDAIFIELLPEAVTNAIENYAIQVELKESQATNERLSLALSQSQSAITIVDLKQNVIYVNFRAEQLSGYSSDDVMNQNIVDIFSKANKEFDVRLMWYRVLTGRYQQCELKKYSKRGESYWVTLSMTAIKGDESEIAFVLVVEDSIDEKRRIKQLEDDIQYRIETEGQLRESKEKERQASEKLALKVEELGFQKNALDEHAIVSIADGQGNIIYVNEKFSDISQYSLDDLQGKNHRILNSGFHTDAFFNDLWSTILKGDVWHGEIRNKAKDGSTYWVASTIVPMLDEEGVPSQYISINTDITDSKNQQSALETMAHYDLLTQLPNRILLSDRFGQAIAHSKRSETSMAICFLDLDDFKPINDTYGHEIGDALLIEVAERIKETIREEDTVSRHGGDEFILLLSNVINILECEKLLERIIQALAQPYILGEQQINISASIGYTLYPSDDEDFDTLVRHADHAMYQAKLAGRNTFTRYNAIEDQQNIKQLSDLHEIEDAMINNDFCLFYQPKVNMKTGELFGVEALIRWQHPDKGIVAPLDFLPIIAGASVEVELGNWVINEALRQLHDWKAHGETLEVSVNISAYHLLSASFFEELKASLANYPDVEPKYLQLEVLENSALGDINKINATIKACQDVLGVTIALDDFGMGYSSLAHLRSLDVNTIKIDQSFVRDMLDDPDDYAIVDGIIGLADAFNHQIIAEGVESTEHGLMLLNMGCEEAQGYCIAKPMPGDDILEWIKEYQPNPDWLDFAKQSHSMQESRKKLFELALEQWASRIENNLNSSPEDLKQWPILDSKKTSCGVWLEREKRTHLLFDEDWLKDIEELNEKVTAIANQLLSNYQSGKFDIARDGLKNLHETVDKIERVLH